MNECFVSEIGVSSHAGTIRMGRFKSCGLGGRLLRWCNSPSRGGPERNNCRNIILIPLPTSILRLFPVYCGMRVGTAADNVDECATLYVSVHPLIQVPNQLVGAPINTDVTLQCQVEASPKAINYWTRDTGSWNSYTRMNLSKLHFFNWQWYIACCFRICDDFRYGSHPIWRSANVSLPTFHIRMFSSPNLQIYSKK